MPVIIDPTTNTEREVDETTYRRMRQSVETDSREPYTEKPCLSALPEKTGVQVQLLSVHVYL